MRVSVVVPCHNAAPYLPQALGSALSQSEPPAEVIVVDDESTDGSLDVALRFQAASRGRVHVLSERSAQACRTRNIGARAATGDALLFLDADDVLGFTAVEEMTRTLRMNPSGVALCPWSRLVLAEGRWIERPPSCAPREPDQDSLEAWLSGWYHPPCSVLWSRTAFEEAGRWDETLALNQDGDLMMRALIAGVPLMGSARGRAYYRRVPATNGSLSGRRRTREGVAARLQVIGKVAFLLDQAGQLAGYRPALARAMRPIARDAEPYPDLLRQARAMAQEFRPAVHQRLAASIRHARRRGGHSISPSRAPALEEVDAGRALARTILAGPPAAADPGAVTRPAAPAVTVIIPTFNRADTVGRAVESVLRQSFTDFELLVVDDGSTDGTKRLLARYTDPRVRILKRDRNAGVSAARNLGLRHARADLVAFLDSDDEWMPTKLERQLECLRAASPAVALVYTGVESVREGGVRTVERPHARGRIYREMLAANVIHGGGSNVLMRRNVVATVGFFHEGVPAIEDYEYWLRVARFFEVEFVDEPLIRYYDPPGPERRSRALEANLAARWWFFRRYAAEMRRAGVAHLFLLKSARRAMAAPEPDLSAARRLAARAVLEAPTSRRALRALARTLLPRRHA